jgi:hypothetical protein
MPVNRDKPDRWKADIAKSVDFYNKWFMIFAPKAFRKARATTQKKVEEALRITEFLANVRPEVLRQNAGVLPVLRMSTCPPLARDRLMGLAGVSKNLIMCMEENKQVPARLSSALLNSGLRKIGTIIEKLTDKDILTWLDNKRPPTSDELQRATAIIADRLCGATADPIIRNAQESRQMATIAKWLEGRGYQRPPSNTRVRFDQMRPGTFQFRLNMPANLRGNKETINIPIDVVIMPKRAKQGALPLLIEAKSAGDFTNVNKRRKEEAKKLDQLTQTYGKRIVYVLFLCGYFDSGYLGYEAAEGIDWIWEHRIDDMTALGL